MPPQKNDGLAVLDQFCHLLAKAETLEEITDIRSRAEAVRVWAKSAAMGLEAQNRAAELKLRAERKARNCWRRSTFVAGTENQTVTMTV